MSQCAEKIDPFDHAEFYDCHDSETLSHDEASVAIVDLIDGAAVKGESILESIKLLSPVTVRAFSRKLMDEAWITGQAEHLAETLEEHACEEYGNLDDCKPVFDQGEIKSKLAEAIKGATHSIWQCDEVGRRDYTAEQVEAICRNDCPDWFQGAEGAA